MALGGDVDHGPHDAGRSAGFGDVGDEAAIDLDLVERETLQIAQRGIAGAEIVQRDTDTDGAKLMQNLQRGFVIADQDGFGDLKFQPMGGRPDADSAATTFRASVPLRN